MSKLDNLSYLFGESGAKLKEGSLIDDPFLIITDDYKICDLMEGLSDIKEKIISSKKTEKLLSLEEKLKFTSLFLEVSSDDIMNEAVVNMHDFCEEQEVFLDMGSSTEKSKEIGRKSFVMNLKVDTARSYDFSNHPYYEDERTILRAMSG